jgi:hypothetical protein
MFGKRDKRQSWKSKLQQYWYQPAFLWGEMSDFPGVASYTWKNNLAWLANVSLRGQLAIWINYSSSNWLQYCIIFMYTALVW